MPPIRSSSRMSRRPACVSANRAAAARAGPPGGRTQARRHAREQRHQRRGEAPHACGIRAICLRVRGGQTCPRRRLNQVPELSVWRARATDAAPSINGAPPGCSAVVGSPKAAHSSPCDSQPPIRAAVPRASDAASAPRPRREKPGMNSRVSAAPPLGLRLRARALCARREPASLRTPVHCARRR